MQYLLVDETDTLMSITKVVGSQNIDELLSVNSLVRSPKIGKQWKQKCSDFLATNPAEVTGARKASLLNSLTGSEDVFEKACLMDENEWKIYSAFLSFPDTLRIPETVYIPYSERVIGDNGGYAVTLGQSGSSSKANNRYGERSSSSSSSSSPSSSSSRSSVMSYASAVNYYNSENLGGSTRQTQSNSSSNPVDSNTYRTVINGLKTSSIIDPGIFNSVNTSPSIGIASESSSKEVKSSNYSFGLPWGRIQLYSTLLSQVIDFPAYPEEVDVGRTANYTSMPDTIYQYEPWIVYQSSGPREQTLTFHLHRDMWTGNHLDGKANELIRFCDANTFPRYSGSAVLAPQVRFYVNGALFISGVLTNTRTHWSGPLGLDNWYLDFELTLTIQEISETALNIDSVNSMGLIGIGG